LRRSCGSENGRPHAHRHLHHIVAILEQSSLDQEIKEKSKRFYAAAEAEAAVHNTTVERIHFHEVGALDAIVILSAQSGLHRLESKQYTSSLLAWHRLYVCAHGKIPVPVRQPLPC
jgi:uncharacterized protein (DUF111 family)